MKLIVGAPVCDRAWALERWFECLAAQTRPPDEYVFIINDEADHGKTKAALHRYGPPPPALSYAIDRTPYVPRRERNIVGTQQVYTDFAARRNHLLRMVLKREPDVFLSLDTDIMLEDPTSIERLLDMVRLSFVASLLTYLHPLGAESGCCNAGYWAPWSSRADGLAQRWERATPTGAIVKVDIPMAVVAMRREVIEECRYSAHESGEDLGFAQDLYRHDLRCAWDTGCEARHLWSEAALA